MVTVTVFRNLNETDSDIKKSQVTLAFLFAQVDFVKLAKANGMGARHVDDPSSLAEIMDAAFQQGCLC